MRNSLNKCEKERLVIIGPMPPPIGGVGVHIERFVEQHKNDYQITILDYSRLSILNKIIALAGIVFDPVKNNYYVNHVNKLIFIALIIRPFYKNIEFYDHNFRYIESTNALERFIFTLFINKIKILFIANENIIEYYAKFGLKIKNKATVKNPFLPPILSKEEELINEYPEGLATIFLYKNPILSANAIRLEKYRNIDLYGADLCIEVTRSLLTMYKDIGFIFFASEAKGFYYEELKDQIIKYHLEDNFFFISGNLQFWPVIKKCDIFIRPTYTDGDAISIREALYFNKKVIASDAVPRPESVILFKNRDSEDLKRKIIQSLTINQEPAMN